MKLKKQSKPFRSWKLSRIFHTLRARLIISVALVHVVLISLFTWDAVERQSRQLRQDLVNQGNSLASLMLVASTNALLAEDLASLAEVVRRVGEHADVEYGEIIDIRGYIMASTREGWVGKQVASDCLEKDRFPLKHGDHIFDICEEIQITNNLVGIVRVGLSTDNLAQALLSTRDRGVQSILIALVIGSIAAWLLSVTVTRNLHVLTNAAVQIGKGDLAVKVDVGSNDETGTLANAFNSMASSLRNSSLAVEKEHAKRTEAERLACVGEMSASIAHEIRNPLSALINSMKLLSSPQLSLPDRNEVVAIVNTESQRLQRILDDFLSFARMPPSQQSAVDINDLLHQTIKLIKRDVNCPEGISIQYEGKREMYAFCDKDQIAQVIFNLVINASQAIDIKGKIKISVALGQTHYKIQFIDDGCGIPKNMLDRITKPFVTSRKSGTGLGLSVVQRILLQHETSLVIRSQEGSGTKMSFELEAVT